MQKILQTNHILRLITILLVVGAIFVHYIQGLEAESPSGQTVLYLPLIMTADPTPTPTPTPTATAIPTATPTPTTYFSVTCAGEDDGVCATDHENYMQNSNTRFLLGDFNGDGRDDIFINSGDDDRPRRRLHLGRSDGIGFDTGCSGEDDGACGTDNEDYMRHSNTRFLVGDFNGDGRDDFFVNSGDDDDRRRRLHLGRSDGKGFDVECSGEEDGVCGTDDEEYMRHEDTRFIVGDFNGDGRDDIFVVSGDENYTRRRLHLGRSDGIGFDVNCSGEEDDVCGTDDEAYMRRSDTTYLVGDFNGDGRDDMFIHSGDDGFTRRRLHLGKADGNGFELGCSGEEDDVCGTDDEDYMRDSDTRFLVGDFNGDGRDDIFIFSGSPDPRTRRLHLGRADGKGFDVSCAGNEDEACGTDNEDYIRDNDTQFLVGQFDGDGQDDLFINSGDGDYEWRKLLLGRSDGGGFTIVCSNDVEDPCHIAHEDYMRDSDTRFLVGDFNGNGRDDLFIISGDSDFRRRALYIN